MATTITTATTTTAAAITSTINDKILQTNAQNYVKQLFLQNNLPLTFHNFPAQPLKFVFR